MGTLCDDIPGHTREIVNEWERFAERQPQLSALPPAHRWDSLPAALRGMLKAALCEPHSADVQRGLVEAALQHGQDRRSAGIGPEVLFQEYAALHDVIWHHLQRVMSATERVDAILKIDMAISLATRGSLSGYHRAEMEEKGSWAGIVDYLINEALLFTRDE